MIKVLAIAAIAAALIASSPSRCLAATTETTETTAAKMKPWPDPARFEKAIAAHEAANTTAPHGALVAYGSSSIVGWHKWIKDDLASHTVVPRGFGGSNMNDALHYMDRVLLPLKPSGVLLYEGDNDVSLGKPTDKILAKYREFITRFQAALPDSRIYLISAKPSISRWKLWPEMLALNVELKKLADAHPLVDYIDVATPMLAADGKPKPEIFLKDNLHMNRQGYDIWRDVVNNALNQNK